MGSTGATPKWSGAVYTVDASRPWPQAGAVTGGKIVYVGSDNGVAAFTGRVSRVPVEALRRQQRMLFV